MSKNNEFYGRDKSVLATCILFGEAVLLNALYVLFNTLINDSHIEVADRHALVVLTLSYVLCSTHNGMTLHRREVSSFTIAMRVVRGTFFFAIVAGIALIAGDFQLPRTPQIIAFWFGFTFATTLYRLLIRKCIKIYRAQKKNVHHVVFLGSFDNIITIYQEMEQSPLVDYKVEGYFDYSPRSSFPAGCEYLGTPDKVIAYLQKHREVSEIFCCLPSAHRADIVPIMYHCLQQCVHFYNTPIISNYLHHRVFLNMFGSVPYFSLYREPLIRTSNRFIKRVFDIAFSLVVLCTVFPLLFIVVAIITKITMPGPLFFRQRRVGENGKEFDMYKFRSMKENQESDVLQATKDDPRITRWGKVMRKFNIDEFPQFINVLLGQMSVVGPRPHMVKHNEEYSHLIDEYMVRHYVKPGITGWSQVSGFRGETRELSQMEGRVDNDIWYIEHWSLSLDIYIIFKTIFNVVRGDKQAY